MRTASGSSDDRNVGIGRNDCGIAAETEAVGPAAAAKKTVVLEAVEADTALAEAGASNNQQNSDSSVNGGSSQQSTNQRW